MGQAGNVEEKRHLERAGSHPNHSCEGVVWPVQVSTAWRGKRGGKQADSEGGQGRGPGRGPNLCSLGVPASSRGTVQLHDALNKPVFFKMRIAKMIPKVGYNRFYLLLARTSVSPSGGKLGAQNKCIFFKLFLCWH